MTRFLGILAAALPLAALLVGCEPEPDPGTPTEPPVVFHKTTTETVVWCTQENLQLHDEQNPEFLLRDDNRCPSTAGCAANLTPVGNRWCSWDEIPWSTSRSVVIEPMNNSAAASEHIELWYAPKGASIFQVVRQRSDTRLGGQFGVFNITFVHPEGTLLFLQEDGTFFEPDLSSPVLLDTEPQPEEPADAPLSSTHP